MSSELQDYIGKEVVIDTKSQYIYIGTLEREGHLFLTLREVDVHDHVESIASKEIYIIEALKYGIKVNRRCAKVVREEIISVSLLQDIVEY